MQCVHVTPSALLHVSSCLPPSLLRWADSESRLFSLSLPSLPLARIPDMWSSHSFWRMKVWMSPRLRDFLQSLQRICWEAHWQMWSERTSPRVQTESHSKFSDSLWPEKDRFHILKKTTLKYNILILLLYVGHEGSKTERQKWLFIKTNR